RDQLMKALALPMKATGAEGDRTIQGFVTLAALVVLVVVASLISLSSGPTGVGLRDLMAYLTGSDSLSSQDVVVLEAVRLPRTALGLLVGAGLAVSGAMMQGLFRNPLADP